MKKKNRMESTTMKRFLSSLLLINILTTRKQLLFLMITAHSISTSRLSNVPKKTHNS